MHRPLHQRRRLREADAQAALARRTESHARSDGNAVPGDQFLRQVETVAQSLDREKGIERTRGGW